MTDQGFRRFPVGMQDFEQIREGGLMCRVEDGRLRVVCTLFPYYDFVRQIGGEDVDVTLLIPAGRETHSFEPTPLDVITLSRADVFIYNGGESEVWVDEILLEEVEN